MSEEKDIWQDFEEVLEQHPDAFKGDPPVDLEYAFKLASTIRWRNWPEEKPKEDAVVIVKLVEFLGRYGFGLSRPNMYTLDNEYESFVKGDQWMYLSDLEVVR